MKTRIACMLQYKKHICKDYSANKIRFTNIIYSSVFKSGMNLYIETSQIGNYYTWCIYLDKGKKSNPRKNLNIEHPPFQRVKSRKVYWSLNVECVLDRWEATATHPMNFTFKIDHSNKRNVGIFIRTRSSLGNDLTGSLFSIQPPFWGLRPLNEWEVNKFRPLKR